MNEASQQDHWLTRPRTIRILWVGFSIVLVLTVLAQALIEVKGYFGLDGWIGFGAVFGFLSCLDMVLFAKALGNVLKRRQDYYGEGDPDA